MVLTFTLSMSVAGGGEEGPRTVLAGAIGCNLAWGLVDAVMYLMANLIARARNRETLHAVRGARQPDTAHRLILDALPSPVAAAMTPAEVETLRQRLTLQPALPRGVQITRTDLVGAMGVFLFVFLSTFPVVIPFFLIGDVAPAMRTSNAIAVAMLFATGWSLGRYAGETGWRTGLGLVAVGLVLVAITMALGG